MSFIATLIPLLVVCTTDAISPDYVTFENNNIQVNGKQMLYNYGSEEYSKIAFAVQDICDYTQACHNTAEAVESFERFRPCCFPCDCTDECLMRGNCCANKTGVPNLNHFGVPINHNGESCVPVPSLGEVENASNPILMVAQCPSQYVGIEKALCENPYDTNIDELAPVTDKVTGLTFRNQYCAKCNDYVNSTVIWNMNMKCVLAIPFNLYQGALYDTVLELVHQYSCQISFIPSLPTRRCWLQGNEKKCNGLNCNTEEESMTFLIIKRNIEYENCLEVPRSKIESPKTHFAFVVLLNIYPDLLADKKTSSQNVLSSKDCEGEVLPAHKCLAKVCVPSQVTIYNGKSTCVKAIESVMGVCLDVRIKVKTTDDAVLMEIILNEIPPLLFDKEFLEKNDINCDYLWISNEDGDKVYHIAVRVHLKVSYNIHALFSKISSKFGEIDTYIVSSISSINADNDRYTLNPMLINEVNYVSFSGYNSVVSGFVCQNTVAMHKLQFCEMYMFTDDDYVMVDTVAILWNGISFKQNEYLVRELPSGRMNIQVCVEDYRIREIDMHSIEAPDIVYSVSSFYHPNIVLNILFLFVLFVKRV